MKKTIYASLVIVIALITSNLAHADNSSAQCNLYKPLVAQYKWNVETALRVMQAESSCNPDAVNLNDRHKSRIYPRDYPSGMCIGSYGLMQESCTRPIYYDAPQNIKQAYEIYQEQGWRAWGVCTNGKVKCTI